MSHIHLKSFMEHAKQAGFTRLNSRAGWKSVAPNAPGRWWMLCNESDGVPELVTVERQSDTLWAMNCEAGTLPLQDLHDGLTNCQWQPEDHTTL